MSKIIILSALVLVILVPTTVYGECTCQNETVLRHTSALIWYKLGAIGSMLAAGAIGVSLPFLGRRLEFLRPENDRFFMIKAFAAGVILGTGFIHVLPDAFGTLSSPCLSQNPWGKFPFTGFVAMIASIGTLMVDMIATGFYKKMHFNKNKHVNEEIGEEHAGDI